MKPPTMVHVLHLALLFVVSSQVFGRGTPSNAAYQSTAHYSVLNLEGGHDILNKGEPKNLVYHGKRSDTVRLRTDGGTHMQRKTSTSIMLKVSGVSRSITDFTHRSLAYLPVLAASPSADGASPPPRQSTSHHSEAKSHNISSHHQSMPVLAASPSADGASPPPRQSTSHHSEAKSHNISSHHQSMPPSSSPSKPRKHHHSSKFSPPALPSSPAPPSHRRHHHRHYHHTPPPVSPPPGSGPKASISPPPPPPRRLRPPLTFPRTPPPPLPRRLRPPMLPSRPPPPPLPRSFPPPPPPPPAHGHSNIPRSPPPGHGVAPPPSTPRRSPPPVTVAPPPLAPRRSPSPPVTVAPMQSSPPPPNEDCGAIICLPPLTKTPFMSPCGCVRPIQVEIELSVPLYSLFPLISVLAANLAEGTVLSPNQVEIMGANADSQNPDNSIVDVNLVPLDQEFDNLTALLIFQKFWDHELVLNTTLFGNYSVVYVHYPGLPPSPPSETDTVGPPGTNGTTNQNPFGVNVNYKSHKLSIGTIAVIALSSAIALVVCLGAFWLLFLKFGCREATTTPAEPGLMSARTKRSGGRSVLSSDLGSSTSMSFTSSMATYASTARTFTFAELDRATDKFRPDNVIGEGGFGRVYSGILDDGRKVAVKVLTRDDQQGGKEFIAEVEMLSRLHHRNLVKLIGICTEEHNRCLVYELIPNGSVESHLHGVDKEVSPLDWEARMKIALGAARGLAYLHEDSNPRVIHRDFKASNILLESDFNPKVSDFGLAKAAPDEGSGHLSTRVMGTFGYVAPEYAMTGHLLVKSDVYSYGVVLLELLSGRKPVDMSQPPGQENLVTWARPLLTSKEGLELLVDPSLGNNFPPDNLARVAAIASMCVQPEVSHRPFMGEVVQALKLVYNDSDVQNGTGSSNGSQGGDSLAESETRTGTRQRWLDQKAQYMPDSTSFISIDYDSGPSQAGGFAPGRPVSASAMLPNSVRFIRHHSSSFRRHSLSDPLRMSRTRLAGYKQRGWGLNKQGSISEHAALSRQFGTG